MDKSNYCSLTERNVRTAGGTYPGSNRLILRQEYGVASDLLITAGFILIQYGSVEKFKEGYRESIGEISEPSKRS
jgi:hypothetical protein